MPKVRFLKETMIGRYRYVPGRIVELTDEEVRSLDEGDVEVIKAGRPPAAAPKKAPVRRSRAW